jgi:hypothetical protein
MSNKAYLSITKKGDLRAIGAVCNANKEMKPGVPSQLLCARVKRVDGDIQARMGVWPIRGREGILTCLGGIRF